MPLSRAARGENEAVVKLLLKKGAEKLLYCKLRKGFASIKKVKVKAPRIVVD
jgi:hypothetical protein